MLEKEVTILLSKVLKQPGGKNYKQIVDIMLEINTPIICVKKSSQNKRIMPFKSLYDSNENFWQQDSSWEYSLAKESLDKIKEEVIARKGSWIDDIDIETNEKNNAKPNPKTNDKDIEKLEVQVGYGSEYKNFADMSTPEKVDRLNKNKQKLNELLALKNKDTEVITEALVDTTKDAALINHTALVDAIRLGDDEAKKLTQDVVDSTHEMVKSSAMLLTSDIFNNELINTLVKKSNGTIVQHMTRVYIHGIAFLSYYNNLVSTSSAIQKLRISFQARKSKYRDFYHKLLPHVDLDELSLERVFYGGMRAIPRDDYFKWAVGFLIHDIGKAANVEYHEGEASYDRNIVIDHVKQGYKSVMNKTNYPMEASLIIGYHHEYYGDPAGYGFFRAFLQQYKKQNPEAHQDYCISYDLEPVLDYHVLAYFPAKVLEIIDVYDSVTDPNRVYRKAMTPEEALAMMREDFIEKHHKLDYVLFDIFDSFIREQQKHLNK
ncbi:MAG: metal-dependent phosphohydrolase [Treponema sp.]|jgi:HD-GYP domain-containing protein (c-di-GMP phosphodiesterase class II)|nr:metal-dependent phosphohydrolase [Treponema sp.]